MFQQGSIAHVYISAEQHRGGSGYSWEWRPQTDEKYGQVNPGHVNLRTSEPRTIEPQTSEPGTSDHEPDAAVNLHSTVWLTAMSIGFVKQNNNEVTTTPSRVADSEILMHSRSNIRHCSSTRRNTVIFPAAMVLGFRRQLLH